MFATVRRGWELTKLSLGVLKHDKELLLFPIMAGVGLLMAVLGFAGLGAALHLGGTLTDAAGLVLGLAYYFVSYFITIYFNTALVGAARIRLDGGDPTLKDGFRTSNSRIKLILGWTLVAATVGLILQILQNMARDNRNFIGQILASLAGTAWSIVSYFVLPIIVAEGLGPIQAVKRSAGVMKRTWGETMVGHVGIGILFLLLGAVGLVPIFLAVMTGSAVALAVVLGVVLLYWLTLIVVHSAASQVLVAALYRFATEGSTGGMIPDQTARAVFDRNADWSAHTDARTGRIQGA